MSTVSSNTMDTIQGTLQHINGSKMTAEQGISRLTLGDIGNRVSAITIDSSKGGAIKKEILQPAEIMLARQRSLKGRSLTAVQSNAPKFISGNIEIFTDRKPITKETLPKDEIQSKEMDMAPVKVEWMPDHNLLPRSNRRDLALSDNIDHVAPMDISNDGMEDAFSKAFFAEHVDDIDAEDHDNPQLVSIYVNSIYSYMRKLEEKYSIRTSFLEGSEITGKMRAILIDWLCQVHNRFHLLQETLYLTVAIIDRYLQVKPCSKNRLQLVGVTAMLVASKYEEMFAPEVADFVYITDNAYTKQDVRDMEQDILRTLDFSFGRPLCLHFLRRNSKAGQVDATKHTLAKYLMELAMIEYDMAHIKPSIIAASALFLAMRILDNSRWTDTLKFYSTYSEVDLQSVSQRLAQLIIKTETNTKLTAVKTKYSSSKFMKIATIPQLKSKFIQEIARVKDAS